MLERKRRRRRKGKKKENPREEMGGSEKRVCSDKDCDVRRNRMHSFQEESKNVRAKFANLCV